MLLDPVLGGLCGGSWALVHLYWLEISPLLLASSLSYCGDFFPPFLLPVLFLIWKFLALLSKHLTLQWIFWNFIFSSIPWVIYLIFSLFFEFFVSATKF